MRALKLACNLELPHKPISMGMGLVTHRIEASTVALIFYTIVD